VSYHKKKDVVVLSTTLKKKRVVQQEVLFALFKKHGRLTYVKELFEYKNQLLNIKD
jgi:ABC-type transporter MlaC component